MKLFNIFKSSKGSNALDSLLDEKNRKIWDCISKELSIEILPIDISIYAAEFNTNSQKWVIYVPNNNLNPALFTHELLHLELQINKIYIGLAIYSICKDHTILCNIFDMSNSFLAANLLDHSLFFNKFINLGYKEEYFACDYGLDKFTKDEESSYTNYFSNPDYMKASHVANYITKIIVLKTINETNSDYTNDLLYLKVLSPELYDIVDNFISEFTILTGFDYFYIRDNYINIIGDFLIKIEKWSNCRLII